MSAPEGRLVDTSLVHNGVPGIRLESDRLLLSVFPDAGGKILDLVHKPTRFNLLWQNPRVGLARSCAGAAFDDVWCGGWDELFPTDPPCTFDGNTYHDHGDLWIGPWKWSVQRDDGEEATLHLSRHSVSLPCMVEKWISLSRGADALTFRHRLRNIGTQPITFLWNLHVAHAVQRGSRIHLPASRLGVEAPYFGRAEESVRELAWPLHEDKSGAQQDLSLVPGPESGWTEFLFARDLREGWCAVTHPSAGVGLELVFDRDVFSTVWLFGVYGGWRGHYFLLTEPCTSPPGSLADAVAGGRAATLEAGESLETEVVATVLTDVGAFAKAHGQSLEVKAELGGSS
jgi:galactose mutarotase-like enzyme